MLGVALPLLGVDFAGDTVSSIVGVCVLSFIALLDIALARFITIPSMRSKETPRGTVESTGFAMIESTGVLAIMAGVGTGWFWAALAPGVIGAYGWMAVRRYFEEWVAAASNR